jgi:hypothetical protein
MSFEKIIQKSFFMEDFMKTKAMLCPLLAGFALVMFANCDADGSRTIPPSEDSEIIEVASGQTRYYSLDPFKEVTGAGTASTGWDIAFQSGRVIQTNSGSTATALGSGGNGGVWHTEKTDIAATALGDRVTEEPSASWSTDTLKYVAGQMGAASRQTVNVMNYSAWSSGDGDSAPTKFSDARYDSGGAKAFISAMEGMPPVYTLSKRVYIIKCGSGNGYHRIQITGYSSANGTYELKHLKL